MGRREFIAGFVMLAQADNTTARAYLQDAENASRALGIMTRTFEVHVVNDLAGAFQAMVEGQADGLITLAECEEMFSTWSTNAGESILDRTFAGLGPTHDGFDRLMR